MNTLFRSAAIFFSMLFLSSMYAKISNAQELYVQLYAPNNDYLEVVLDASQIGSNEFISSVSFAAALTDKNGQTTTVRLSFAKGGSLRPGQYRDYIAHGRSNITSVRGGGFNANVGAGGARADDPGKTIGGKATNAPRQGGKLLTAAPAKSTIQKTFTSPSLRIDWCKSWARDCGKPAADEYCRRIGYRDAASFVKANNIGLKTPTVVITTGQVCKTPGCDGFSKIVCRM